MRPIKVHTWILGPGDTRGGRTSLPQHQASVRPPDHARPHTGQDTGQSRSTDLTKLGSQPDWPPAPSAYRRTKSTPSGYAEYSDLLTISAFLPSVTT